MLRITGNPSSGNLAFRITKDSSSGSLAQRLAKNYKNDSFVSVDMDKVGICSHNTNLVHVNRHERIILVIFSQALCKAP